MVDPATRAVDHANIDLGVGLILSTAGVNRLRTDQPNVILGQLNILLEHTIFGVAMSGSIPDSLKAYVEIIHQNNITPVIISE